MTTGYKVRQPGVGDHYHSGHSGHSGHGGHDDPDEQSRHGDHGLHGGHGGHNFQFRSIFTFIECFQRLRAW